VDVDVVGDVVVNLVGDGDMNVDDNGGDQVPVAVAVNVVDHDDDDDHVKVNVGPFAPSDRNHWREQEDYNRRRSHPALGRQAVTVRPAWYLAQSWNETDFRAVLCLRPRLRPSRRSRPPPCLSRRR